MKKMIGALVVTMALLGACSKNKTENTTPPPDTTGGDTTGGDTTGGDTGGGGDEYGAPEGNPCGGEGNPCG